MLNKHQNALLSVLRSATEDEEYCQLAKDHERLTKKYLEMLPTLTEEQQTALSDYWAVVHAMHQRLCPKTAVPLPPEAVKYNLPYNRFR